MHIQARPRSARTFTLRLLGLILALVLAGGLASASHMKAAKASDAGTFTGIKDCRGTGPNPPGTTGSCLITASTLEILRGATMHYTSVVWFSDHLASPVTITAVDEEQSTATGQCTFYYAGHGHCEFWSGTGDLEGFNAAIVVGSTATAGVYSLAGTYSFNDD